MLRGTYVDNRLVTDVANFSMSDAYNVEYT